jgi:hypothetical protein
MTAMWLTNSAMMPRPGTYHYRRLPLEEWRQALIEAHYCASLVNCIGYPENLRIIREITGIHLEPSRRETAPEPGDGMLVMRLRRRLADPALKGRLRPRLDDFEFGLVSYEAGPNGWPHGADAPRREGGMR